MPKYKITKEDASNARETFEKHESRDIFYKAATELIRLSIANLTTLKVSEALAVLLQTWNVSYYRFTGKFDNDHFNDIEKLLESHKNFLSVAHERKIQDLNIEDISLIKEIFVEFEKVLGAVGASKSLHLLAQNYFPLWDRKIAKAYVGELKKAGSNGDRYTQMMTYASEQSQKLIESGYEGNPLKAIDEYNYCRFSMGWLKTDS